MADVQALRDLLTLCRKFSTEPIVPDYVKEQAEGLAETITGIFESATGTRMATASAPPAVPAPVAAPPAQPAEAPSPVVAKITQRGDDFQVVSEPGHESAAMVLRSLLNAAAGKPVSELSARAFELAVDLQGRGL